MFPDQFAMETRAACERQRRRAEADHERRLGLLPRRPSPIPDLCRSVAAMLPSHRRPSPWPGFTRLRRARGVAWDRPRLVSKEIE